MRAVIAMLFVFAIAADAQTPAGHITGSVAYRERIALSPTAVVEVLLEDASRANAPGAPVASTRIASPGQPPIRFDLTYEPTRIDAGRRYSVRARILDGTHVLFESMSPVLVLTQGHPSTATLNVTMMAPATTTAAPAIDAPAAPRARVQAPAPRLTSLPATFTGTLPCADCPGIQYQLNLMPDDSYFMRMIYGDRQGAPFDQMGSWVLSSDRRVVVLQGLRDIPELFAIRDAITLRKLDADGQDFGAHDLRRAGTFQPLPIGLSMQGIYKVAAGGGRFVECSTAREWLVEGKPADFEPRYRQVVGRANAPLLVTVDAHLVPEPGNLGAATLMNVVFDRLTTTSPGKTCAPRFAGAPLEGTTWKLVRVGDTTVTPSVSPSSAPQLTFSAVSKTFAGSGGCNRLAGSYTVSGSDLRLKGVGTLRACSAGGAMETVFRGALDRTRGYRILGRMLDLLDEDHRLIARFEGK